jgi:opacity protein-like surface antigen
VTLIRTFVTVSLLAVAGSALAQANTGKSWDHVIQPYILATSISGDAGMGRVSGVPVDVSFSDILENLSMGFMLHYEAEHRSGWGFGIDYAFMELDADTTVGVGGVLDASLRQAIFEGIVTYEMGSGSSQFQALAGIRRWDNDVRASFDPLLLPGSASVKAGDDWIDPIVGARWTNSLSERWQLRLRADVGGFGVGSDFTWNLMATAIFQMNNRFDLEFGYRGLGVDFDNEKDANSGFFKYDTTTHGPLVGLSIKF